jgi:hypothetical protein
MEAVLSFEIWMGYRNIRHHIPEYSTVHSQRSQSLMYIFFHQVWYPTDAQFDPPTASFTLLEHFISAVSLLLRLSLTEF